MAVRTHQINIPPALVCNAKKRVLPATEHETLRKAAFMAFFSSFKRSIARFLQEEDAPTMAEYGLLLLLIAIVVIVGVQAVGVTINTALFERAAAAFPSGS